MIKRFHQHLLLVEELTFGYRHIVDVRGEMKSTHRGGGEHVQLETFSIVYLRRYREGGDTHKRERGRRMGECVNL